MATKEEIIASIKEVYDPEIPVNVFDLGLIYNVDVQENGVSITMSLTSPQCPSAKEIPENIKARLKADLNVDNVDVEVVWEPTWSPLMISDEGKQLLGIEE